MHLSTIPNRILTVMRSFTGLSGPQSVQIPICLPPNLLRSTFRNFWSTRQNTAIARYQFFVACSCSRTDLGDLNRVSMGLLGMALPSSYAVVEFWPTVVHKDGLDGLDNTKYGTGEPPDCKPTIFASHLVQLFKTVINRAAAQL